MTFLPNTAGYRRDLRRAEYGDERDPTMRAFLERISPAEQRRRASEAAVRGQGANDPRVPVSESEQMVWRGPQQRRRRSGTCSAKDEGHGFASKANRDAYLETVASFLQKMAR